MADKATDIATLLRPTVASLGLELLGAEYLSAPASAVLRLYIDRPGADPADPSTGVTIEDCEAVSREVSAQLDVEDPISSQYTLEVSSPGVDRLLFNVAQFAQFMGQRAKVALKLPQDGRRRLQGVIAAVAAGEDGRAGTVTFDVDGEALAVSADNIDKARLMPDWVALGYAPAQDASGRDARPGKQGDARPRGAKRDGGNAGAASDQRTNKPAASKPTAAEERST